MRLRRTGWGSRSGTGPRSWGRDTEEDGDARFRRRALGSAGQKPSTAEASRPGFDHRLDYRGVVGDRNARARGGSARRRNGDTDADRNTGARAESRHEPEPRP